VATIRIDQLSKAKLLAVPKQDKGRCARLFIAAFYKHYRKITGNHLVNFLISKKPWVILDFSYFSHRKSSTITIANAIPFSHFAK
jgi:hypothetical protein